MFSLVVLLHLITQLNGAPSAGSLPGLDGRIVGGYPTAIEEYPHQVSLQLRSMHICGGTTISDTFVVTAAHCTTGTVASQLSVRAGSSFRQRGGSVVRVRAVYQSPKFNMNTMDYDVSVLRLAQKLTFGVSIAPIRLADRGMRIDRGVLLMATGWGSLVEDGPGAARLQVVKIPFVELQQCRAAYNGMEITERMLCAGAKAGGKDTCQGDSGGPLVYDGVLVGIVSWGFGCAQPQYPGVYTDISRVRDYIEIITKI